MVNKNISFSKCILNYRTMTDNCKYYKSASVVHKLPKEQCLCAKPALHGAVLGSRYTHSSLSWAKAPCTSTFGLALCTSALSAEALHQKENVASLL